MMLKITTIITFLAAIGCNDAQTGIRDGKTTAEESAAHLIKSEKEIQGEETLKIANAYMAAIGQGDMGAMKKLMHEDMVWQNEGDSSLPWIGPWNGKKSS